MGILLNLRTILPRNPEHVASAGASKRMSRISGPELEASSDVGGPMDLLFVSGLEGLAFFRRGGRIGGSVSATSAFNASSVASSATSGSTSGNGKAVGVSGSLPGDAEEDAVALVVLALDSGSGGDTSGAAAVTTDGRLPADAKRSRSLESTLTSFFLKLKLFLLCSFSSEGWTPSSGVAFASGPPGVSASASPTCSSLSFSF